MTEENKQMLAYINYQMKHGVSFESICNNFGFLKNEELKAAISKMETTTEKKSEVEVLKIQIEKMKCCGNCAKMGTDFEKKCFQDFGSKNCKWELQE